MFKELELVIRGRNSYAVLNRASKEAKGRFTEKCAFITSKYVLLRLRITYDDNVDQATL